MISRRSSRGRNSKATSTHLPQSGPYANRPKYATPSSKQFLQPAQIPLSNIDLTPEFRDALDLLENSQNHLYITGKAGTGKSTLLRYFRETTKKNVAVVAPTGIAAINVSGQTIHSLLRLPPRFLERNDVRMQAKIGSLLGSWTLSLLTRSQWCGQISWMLLIGP